MRFTRILSSLLLLLLLSPVLLFAQKKVSLSGYVHDAGSGESLIAATVFIKEANEGGQTNTYGFYSVSVPPGKYTVIYSYVGYGTVTETMDLVENKTFNANLQYQSALKEVEITAA